MIDQTTEYLGLKLKSPLVVSSSPLTDSPEKVQRLEEAGAAAVVLPSIFEEQLTLESNALDSDLSRGTESFAESLSYFPAYESYRQGHDAYLGHIRRAKSVAGIPVLASLNGATAGGWVKFAKEIEQAGADALELNTYSLPTDPRVSSSAIEDDIDELSDLFDYEIQAKTCFKVDGPRGGPALILPIPITPGVETDNLIEDAVAWLQTIELRLRSLSDVL